MLSEIVPDQQVGSTINFFQQLHANYNASLPQSQQAALSHSATRRNPSTNYFPNTGNIHSASSAPQFGQVPTPYPDHDSHIAVNIQAPTSSVAPVEPVQSSSEPTAYVLFYVSRVLECIILPSIIQRCDRAFFELLQQTYNRRHGSTIRNLFSLNKIDGLQFTKVGW